jgi:crotonobetainyl-CoA:carnitine CoA-transferase CaiB-like acyl-CoA transferase
VRVIDASTSYAGPTAAMYLGDLGADVIKVERPGTGDDARLWGPPFLGEMSAWFASANRNKRSVVLDLRSRAGVEAFQRLLETADVLVTNLNPAKLARHGMAPEQVRARHPRLVLCTVSGFGLTGPDAALAGYDLVAQARSGLMSVTGPAGGLPERVSTALSDIAAGLVAATGVLAALLRRTATGDGDVVDVSLLDTDLALMAPRIAAYLAGAPEPAPSGGTDSVLAVYQPLPTADRPIVVAVGNDGIWQRLCDALALPHLATDPRLADNAGRRAHRAEVLAELATALSAAPAQHWLQILASAGVPAARISSLSEVVADPQVVARGALRAVPGIDLSLVTAPWRIGSQPAPAAAPPPRLGEHTESVLRELGYSGTGLDRLVADGVGAGAA